MKKGEREREGKRKKKRGSESELVRVKGGKEFRTDLRCQSRHSWSPNEEKFVVLLTYALEEKVKEKTPTQRTERERWGESREESNQNEEETSNLRSES